MLGGALEDADLMTQCDDLQLQSGTAPKRGGQEGKQGAQDGPERDGGEDWQLPIYQSDPGLRERQTLAFA